MRKLLQKARKVFSKKSKLKPADKDCRLVDYTKPHVNWRDQEFYKFMRLALTSQWDRLAGVLQLSTDRVRDLIKLPPIGKCSHLKAKGPYKNEETEFSQNLSISEHGRVGPITKDYDVYLHRFIDGTQRIHCRRCGENWFEGQPGWDKAVAMTQQSTNRASASEMPIQITPAQYRKLGQFLKDPEVVVTCFDDLLYKKTDGVTEESIQEDYQE